MTQSGDFLHTLIEAPLILTEGSLIERINRDPRLDLDPHVAHAGFLYDPPKKAALKGFFRDYLEIGKNCGLPMLVGTPTWRANPERLALAGLTGNVNGDGVRLLAQLRDAIGRYADQIFIGGLLGCRGDAYDPTEALSESAACEFHRPQTEALAKSGPDFLMAATLPALSEALGISRAFVATGLPYLISFVIRPTGELLDGTPLHEAVDRIDQAIESPPASYLINCVHPANFRQAMTKESALSPTLRRRIIGLQANTSRMRPEELDGRDTLDTEEPAPFARAMLDLHRDFGIRVLGGCCGTDPRHIQAMADGAEQPANG